MFRLPNFTTVGRLKGGEGEGEGGGRETVGPPTELKDGGIQLGQLVQL